MTFMIIPVGNVGTGKSLIARKYAQNGCNVINMDTIQAMIAGGIYGRYRNHKRQVYHEIETAAIKASIENKQSVYIDRTNINRKTREKYLKIGKEHGSYVVAIDFGPGGVSSIERRQEDPKGISNKTWSVVHSDLQNKYEKPTTEEGFNLVTQSPLKYRFYAFDFDGTIVENNFPNIGAVREEIVSRIKDLWEKKENIIIIWTCRFGTYLNEAREFLLNNAIPFDFINENPLTNLKGPKIFAHEYYDDRNKT